MKRGHVLACGVLLGSLLLLVGLGAPAQTPDVKKELTLVQRLALSTRLSEENADRFLQALGPAIREELRRGRDVEIPGLGRLRVVRVQEHRDMQNGRPIVVPAANRVEFNAADVLDDAANSAGAKPAETVVPFHYIPLPGQTPSQKVGNQRTPPTRVK